MTTGSFSDQLHDLWRTRPLRLPQQGHVAGVAAGVGQRYSVDPVLVRVAFVVSTLFGGAGIILYLVGWLLLGKPGDQVSPAESLFGRGRSSQSGTKTVVLVVALAIALSTIGPIGFGMGGSVLLSFALMLGGLWLLYQRRPVPPALPASVQPPVGYPVSPFQTTPTAQAAAYPPPAYGPYTRLPDHYEPSPGPSASSVPPAAGVGDTAPDGPTPPAWDPLGVAPFAWDLPEPARAPEPPEPIPGKPRTRFTSVVLGLAVLAAAAATGVWAATGAEWLTPARIGGIALAVIGVGLLIGAFLRRGYGLLTVAFPLAGFVILASVVGPLNWDESKLGDHVWTPRSPTELAPVYEGTAGDFTLDLRQLELTETSDVRLEGKLGNYTVIVPQNMDVHTDCSVVAGDVDCIGDGFVDGGADGINGPVLNVTVDNKLGEVRVYRG
ncbi:PspC domain-containing protein [Rhodococcus sp. SGAir0479]|uniref:PspC domain-containing protein n=1 Tax=Rhodococcus sp. SGAir0479 TaxID=2567884 RepID=UPI0010CD3C6E|nr:PspC domain-containing protein [Rhodococcus sp. SGAir0479]QCQ92114.1 PspC domain-containing protein [Rhodococcus sp. SGAir0479]